MTASMEGRRQVSLNAGAAERATRLAERYDTSVADVLREGLTLVALAADLRPDEYLAVRKADGAIERVLVFDQRPVSIPSPRPARLGWFRRIVATARQT